MVQFNLELQYQLYLKRVGLKEKEMNPVQRIETKRAFMGACGQMLILMRDEIGGLSEEEGVHQLQKMLNQVVIFWQEQRN